MEIEGFPNYITKDFLLNNKSIQKELEFPKGDFVRIRCLKSTPSFFDIKIFFVTKRRIGGHVISRNFRIDNDLFENFEMIKKYKGTLDILPRDVFGVIKNFVFE